MVDCHFIVMNLLCIGFFYLIFVVRLHLFFLLVVSTCVLICLLLLLDGFLSLIFNYRVFLLAGNPFGHLMLALVTCDFGNACST